MGFPLSAVDAEEQDYGLQFHPLLSEHIFDFLALGVLNLRKSFLGGEFTRAFYLKEVTKPLLEEKIAHMVLTFHIVSKITQHMQLPAQCRLCGSRVHY